MSLRKRVMPILASVLALVLCIGASACAGSGSTSGETSDKPALEGKSLKVYCGAGMKDPFTDISAAFEEQTGCKVEVTYANAAQIQTQIKTTEEGDFFIAGSKEELQPVEGYVDSSTDLVKHVPVLVVPNDNPAQVSSIDDLAKCDRVLVGDPESTPIGKIANKVLTNAGLWDSMMADGKITTTTTAPQIATALANGEGQAGIVWKENAGDGVTVIETPQMQKAVKVIPAAQLTCCSDKDTAKAFNDFLQSDAAREIWTKYGYEVVEASE